MYFIMPHMYFRMNLKMKKPTLCCCFTWIVFIKLNFTVALLLISNTWMTDLPVRCGGWRILNGGILVMVDDDFEMRGTEGLISLYGPCE